MISQTWWIVGCSALGALVGLVLLWRRKPLFRWSCRRCKKIVSRSRFHPAKCTCGTRSLVAYFCRDCRSWNTTPTPNWHCGACSSKDISLGVEYNFGTGLWRTRNRNTKASFFSRSAE